MISKLISSLNANALKSTFKIDQAIDDILLKFKDGCPTKDQLKGIISQKNTMVTTLGTLQGILENLSKTGQTLEGIITGIQAGVQVIKLLPVPLPPFTPLTVPNMLADSLDTLGDLLKKGKGDVKMIPDALKGTIPEIEKVVTKLNTLDGLLANCIQEQGLTQEDVGEILSNDGPFSGEKSNKEYNKNLLNQLQPSSNNPLFYKGFKLEIQYDPKNEFSFDSRRIKATQTFQNIKVGSTRRNQNITLYNLENNGYSYSSSVEILINEAKFRIDNFYSKNPQYRRLNPKPTKSPSK